MTPARLARPILALSVLLAQAGDPPSGRYASLSGEWTLSVTRPERDWNGLNELVLARGEAPAWSASRALGLRFALVADDGHVAGYGYTGEPRAGVRPGTSDGPYGSVLRVFVLDPRGRLLLDESHVRGGALESGHEPAPVARGAFLVPELRRFVVRIADPENRGDEHWWAFDIATGAALFRERPRSRLALPAALGPLLDARAVPGTPLVLLQWQRVEALERSFRVTNVYHLLEPDWNLVWTHELASEKSRRPDQDYLGTGGRGTTLGPERFELHPLGGGASVSFELQREGARWIVSEVER